MVNLSGRLRSTTGAGFPGHRVQLQFQEKIDLSTLASTHSTEGNTAGGTGPRGTTDAPPNDSPLRKTALRSASVEEDEDFRLQLPERGPFSFEVLAPDGQVLYLESLDELPQESDRHARVVDREPQDQEHRWNRADDSLYTPQRDQRCSDRGRGDILGDLLFWCQQGTLGDGRKGKPRKREISNHIGES